MKSWRKADNVKERKKERKSKKERSHGNERKGVRKGKKGWWRMAN